MTTTYSPAAAEADFACICRFTVIILDTVIEIRRTGWDKPGEVSYQIRDRTGQILNQYPIPEYRAASLVWLYRDKGQAEYYSPWDPAKDFILRPYD